MRKYILITMLALFAFSAKALDINERSAVTLNNVTLYPDSTFFEHSSTVYEEGYLFEILDETVLLHEDSDQKQKFKWYHVKTPDGKTGWMFGDGLAVYVPKEDVEEALKPYFLKDVSLNYGFEEATMWVAAIQGKDNFNEKDYLNPVYSEFYFIISNSKGRSLPIKCSGSSTRGVTVTRQFSLQDVTGDAIPDFIIERNTSSSEDGTDDRILEVHSMQAGTLSKVFEEALTLRFDRKSPAPSLFKFTDIEASGFIRTAYIDYADCEDYEQSADIGKYNKNAERCLEYVTASYVWDDFKKTFDDIYEETRVEVEGQVKSPTFLTDKPTARKHSGKVAKGKVTIVKHSEAYIVMGGKERAIYYLYVKTEAGDYGYLPAEKVRFTTASRESTILNQFYLSKPNLRKDWKSKTSFLKIEKPKTSDALTKKNAP